MEDIPDVYEMPYNPWSPVVCMDEKPYQLLGEVREPLGGVRHISVCEHRTAIDWAEEIKYLVDVSYPDNEKIVLVMDNLNTHAVSKHFQPVKPDGL